MGSVSIVPPLLQLLLRRGALVSGTMALRSGHFTVYVAFHLVFLALFNPTVAAEGGGGSGALSLLQPYDLLYYSGVRAYFGEEWGKAAELLEKSLLTRESLLGARRRCHGACVAAGGEELRKLGKT